MYIVLTFAQNTYLRTKIHFIIKTALFVYCTIIAQSNRFFFIINNYFDLGRKRKRTFVETADYSQQVEIEQNTPDLKFKSPNSNPSERVPGIIMELFPGNLKWFSSHKIRFPWNFPGNAMVFSVKNRFSGNGAVWKTIFSYLNSFPLHHWPNLVQLRKHRPLFMSGGFLNSQGIQFWTREYRFLQYITGNIPKKPIKRFNFLLWKFF